eukprot:257410-Amphidinium_carterae.1
MPLAILLREVCLELRTARKEEVGQDGECPWKSCTCQASDCEVVERGIIVTQQVLLGVFLRGKKDSRQAA